MNCNSKVIKAVINKEFTDFFNNMIIHSIIFIVSANIMQLMSIYQLVNLNLPLADTRVQAGNLVMYLVMMVMVMMGQDLCFHYYQNERKDKIINILLAMGMNKVDLWIGKNIVIFIVSYITTVLSIILNFILIRVIFQFWIMVTPLQCILALVTMPILCMGFLLIISLTYWCFKKNSVVSILLPMITFLTIWNLSLKLVKKYPNYYLILISLAIGIILSALSIGLLKRIPKENIVK